MENPIKYSDLVNPDVKEGFDAWIKQIEQLRAQTLASIEEMKKQIASLGGQLKNTGSGTQIKPQIDELDKLRKIYESLNVDVKLYDDAIQALNKSDRERKRVLQLSTELERTRENSYDRLQAQYNTLKTLVNNMTQAERENTEAGRLMVEQLKEMYEKMNMMQQATGKYQLQVGQYSKAISGLKIATTQVIRELPALAISPATFAIAISNNVPILVDYIEKVNELKVSMQEQIATAEAAGEAEKVAALKAQAAKMKNLSVTKLLAEYTLSWRSILVFVLMVLPAVLRKLSQKRKEQEKYNSILQETINLEKELADTDLKAAQAGAQAASKAKTMYEITQDQTRAYKERLAVAQELQRLYPSYLGNMDAEMIVAGQAKTAYDSLTESLIKKARAQAYLNKISELEKQRINEEIAHEKEVAKIQEKKYTRVEQSTAGAYVVAYSEEDTAKMRAAEKAQIDKVFNERLQQIDNFITLLTSKISGEGLIEDLTGGKGGKSVEKAIHDYYFEMRQAQIDAMDEGLAKELAQIDLDHQKTMQKWSDNRADFLERRKTANAKDQAEIDRQLEFIKEAEKAEKEIYEKQISDLLDKSDTNYEDVILKEYKDRVDTEKLLRDKAIQDEFFAEQENGADMVELKKKYNDAMLESEIQYWKDYLQLLKDGGLLTLEQWVKINSKIISLQEQRADSEKSTTRRHRRLRRRNYGGLFEFFGAQSEEYGEKTDDYVNRVVKEEYEYYFQDIDKMMLQSIDYMQEWMDTRVQMAEIAVESAQKEQEAAKTALDYELEARANGYANNVELAQKEYEQKRKLAKKAAKDAQELARVQRAIDTAQQIQSLITATANIWSAEGIKGIAGVPLALGAIAAMWGSFAAAKIKAEQLAKAQTETYGEGMSEYLGYGGSHASGHDIDFGMKPDGTRRRVERGEMIGVINKRNVRKYGAERVSDIISSLNHGTFENMYGNAFVGSGIAPQGVDLHKLEKGVSELVEQGGQRVLTAGGKTIVYYKNTKKIIKS